HGPLLRDCFRSLKHGLRRRSWKDPIRRHATGRCRWFAALRIHGMNARRLVTETLTGWPRPAFERPRPTGIGETDRIGFSGDAEARLETTFQGPGLLRDARLRAGPAPSGRERERR